MARPPFRSRPGSDVMSVAEAAFKAKAAPIAPPAEKPKVIPGAKELVSLRIDQDVLAYFQEDGPGWQDRIVDVLREAARKGAG